MAIPAENTPACEDFSRYKRYPVQFFNKWRTFVHLFALHFIVVPYINLFVRPKVYGRRNRPARGPYIIAAHHITMFDPMLVSWAVRYPVAYMAKVELFQHPLMARVYYSLGTFALDRDNPDSATLKTAFNVLKSPERWALCIFPEGTRSKTGEVLPLKKGIGGLAKKTGLPVLPIGLYREESTQRFVVTIGEAITDVTDAETVQDKVYEALAHLSDPNWKRT